MNIGERLKKVRKGHGYTLAEVSGSIGIGSKIYSAYECGRARTPVNVLIALSNFYRYNSLDLLLGNPRVPGRQESELEQAYRKAGPEKRKIIDFILSLNN